MLQQTRVAAVLPYFERFLKRFPRVLDLAKAPESDLLTLWSGLGYYTRVRNLRQAAKQIVDLGEFPSDYDSIRHLAGIGDYTAAAVASIAFRLPHAVVDGNVRRVIARLTNDPEPDARGTAERLLDARDPGRWNQAMMELGALVCLPRKPDCAACPVARHCEAKEHGTEQDLPQKRLRPATESIERTLLVIQDKERLLLTPSERVKGFWDLPEPYEGSVTGKTLGTFLHTITHRRYRFTVCRGTVLNIRKPLRWWMRQKIYEIPLSTTAKKALRFLEDTTQGVKLKVVR